MTPIINPMWFYWINFITNLQAVVVAILFITGAYVILYAICMDGKFPKWLVRSAAIIGVIGAVLVTVLPSESTMYKMMVASYATGDNLEEISQTIKNSVDYIFEKIEGK
jgi:hypothetical protein